MASSKKSRPRSTSPLLASLLDGTEPPDSPAYPEPGGGVGGAAERAAVLRGPNASELRTPRGAANRALAAAPDQGLAAEGQQLQLAGRQSRRGCASSGRRRKQSTSSRCHWWRGGRTATTSRRILRPRHWTSHVLRPPAPSVGRLPPWRAACWGRAAWPRPRVWDAWLRVLASRAACSID